MQIYFKKKTSFGKFNTEMYDVNASNYDCMGLSNMSLW